MTTPLPSSIITVTDVKLHDGDAALQVYIDAATELIESMVGPVVPRTVVQTITSNGTVLLEGRVLSVQSVVRYGVTLPAADYTLNASAGLLTGHLAGAVVTYTVGFDPIPAAIRTAAIYMAQHAAESDAGAVVNGQGGGDEVFTLSRGFFVPNRAKELLAPYLHAPVLA